MTPPDSRHGEEEALDAQNADQRRTLAWVLGVNLLQAAVGGTVGYAAESVALMGAALDNLADGGVYAISLYAIGRGVRDKIRAARVSGVFLIVLGIALLVEVVRRFVVGAEPIGIVMIVMAAANAATNLVCLRLLRRHRRSGVHLNASWIFTSNDMIANGGIALSGIAVWVFVSPIPDLVIGLIVVAIALKGGWEILQQARHARAQE
jgi:Co/Zn/Cd efflux system component